VLTTEQKNVVRDLLAEKETVKFEAIYEALKKAGCYDHQDRTFNTDRFSRQELCGDSTRAAFRALDKKAEKRTGQASNLFDTWQALPPGVQVSVINFLADLGSPQEVDRDGWETQYTRLDKKSEKRVPRRFDPAMVAFINQMVDSGEFDRLGKMGFDGGRAAYSVKALNQLTGKMREGIDEDKAVAAVYGARNQTTGEIQRRLDLHALTGNTVVDVALRELWREVNKMLDMLKEPPAEIIVELMRDMGLGVNRRRMIEENIRKNQDARRYAAADLKKNGFSDTSSNIHRYLLWQEQVTNCPYCGKKLGLSDAVDGNITNRDHIVPKSLTRVGRQSDHLVLAHQGCNDEKGARTPWQAWGSDPERWALIEAHAKALKDKKRFTKARLLVLKDYEAEVLDDEAIEGFSARQFHQTSWIAKLAAQWLRSICLDTSVSRGALTAYLRRIWGLDTVIPQVRYEKGMTVFDTDELPVNKEDFDRYRRYWEGHDRSAAGVQMTDRRLEKRIDHRHHVIDALITAMASRSLFMKMARNYKTLAERRNAGERVWPKLAEKPPMVNIRKQALEMVRHCNLTHKPDRFPAGAFFQGTAYRRVEMDDGKKRLVVRAKLVELTDYKGSLEKARKGIGDIVSDETRKIVSDEFERRIKLGKGVKESLGEPMQDTRYDLRDGKQAPPKLISKVRVYQRIGRGFVDGENAVPVEHQSRDGTTLCKYYLSDGYAYLSLKLENGGLTSAESIPLHVAPRRPTVKEYGEIRFYPNETLRDKESGQVYVVRQIKASATLVLTLATEAREVADMDANSGLKISSGQALLKFEHV
jgi:CRISPR-associated endonuclease Csn1